MQELFRLFFESLVFFIAPYYLFFIVMRITFKKDIIWCIFDYANLYLPIIIWCPIFMINNLNKTPANAVIEPYIIAVIAILLLMIRIIIGKKINKYRISISTLFFLCLISLIIGFFFPYVMM